MELETKRKPKKVVKKILIAIGIIVTILLSILIIVGIKELQQESILRREILAYSNKDLAKDSFPIDIKSKGDCAYIEEAVKKYYKELSDNVKEMNSYLSKDEFKQILSSENLTKDHPDFILSHATIKNTKEKLQTFLKNIERLCDEKTIKNLIDKEKLSDEEYYYDLYKELMYSKKDIEELTATKEKMKNLSLTLNEFLDKIDEMITYLQVNDSQVDYSSNGVLFKSEKNLTEYKKLLTELQAIAGKFANIGTSEVEKGSEI